MSMGESYYTKDETFESLPLWELQYRLLFSVIVAGKNAKFAHNVMDKLVNKKELPFTTIKRFVKQNRLRKKLEECKTGNYGKFEKCLPDLIKLDPKTCSIDDMEKVNGIGPKTSRFYLLWIGKKMDVAALDVHILHFLRDLGYEAPKATPSSKNIYKKWEQTFLDECKKRKTTPNQLDADVWVAYSKKDDNLKNKLLFSNRV